MKKIFALFCISAALIISCSEESNNPSNQEFIADDNTFAGFSSWTLEATNTGLDPSLGTAHGSTDTTIRKVYIKDGKSRVDGKYPVGTLIVKHSQNLSGSFTQYAAMAKRGNNYNVSGGDWEFFLLSSDGKVLRDTAGVQRRGFNLSNGACINCHVGAAGKDFVFSKD